MRVRTYGFPGCFTRPPGTSTRDHPHEPTASKPVVPAGCCVRNIVAPSCKRGRCRTRSRRGPSRFEEPSTGCPRGFRSPGGAASHLSGLALLRLKIRRLKRNIHFTRHAAQGPPQRHPASSVKMSRGPLCQAIYRPAIPQCHTLCVMEMPPTIVPPTLEPAPSADAFGTTKRSWLRQKLGVVGAAISGCSRS